MKQTNEPAAFRPPLRGVGLPLLLGVLDHHHESHGNSSFVLHFWNLSMNRIPGSIHTSNQCL